MPEIRPISDLRNNFNEVASKCRERREPVFITRNGFGDLVLMSMETYEEQQAQLALYRKLEEAESELQNGAVPLTHDEVFGQLKVKYGPKQ